MIAEVRWQPIKSMPPAAKALLPVSVVRSPDGTTTVVSRHGDEVWDFYPYIPQDNLSPHRKRLSWAIAMPDGRMLTDPVHRSLLSSAKDFIWAGYMSPPEGRPRSKALTVIKNLRHLTPLLRWMISRGLSQFGEVDAHIAEYVSVARRRARTTGQDKEATPGTIAQRLLLVEDLFRQREKLADALGRHPWPLETACALAGYKQTASHLRPKTEFIPDTVVERLARAALDYVQLRAESILGAVEAADVAAIAVAERGGSPSRQSDARCAVARQRGYQGFRAVEAESVWLRTACYIVIDLFSGIRDSEMVSLEDGCVRQGVSRDGRTQLLWLHGTMYKTGHRAKKWLVPQIVGEAVRVLARLTAPQRERMERELVMGAGRTRQGPGERARLVRRMTLVGRQRRKLFLGMTKGSRDGGPSALDGSVVNRNLKRFCAKCEVKGADGRAYPLRSHQFRRTYARWVAKAELGDLLYLRDHFGHWSIDMTMFYADGAADGYEADTELVEMVAGEKVVRQQEVLGHYLTSNAPLANGGHWLKEWRHAVRTARNRRDLVAEYSTTIALNGTGHSWCIGNARGAGCGGLCVFEAQMCVDCSCGVIGQEHRAVWEGIRDQQVEALALADMGPGGRARAEAIRRVAEKVLERLNGKEVP